MTTCERAVQIWSVLAMAAGNRQVLTYEIVGRLTGVPRQGLGQLLEPIQSYCLVNNLPPLTILVVSEATGIPSAGFVAANDIPLTQQKVFTYDWMRHGAPSLEDLEEAVRQCPSNGTSGVKLSETKRRELERRVAEDDSAPDDVIPWEQVKAEALARLTQ